MIDWIDEMCRIWGRQKGGYMRDRQSDFRPVGELKDGPPFAGRAQGMAGRMIEEGAVGAAIRSEVGRSPPEVLTGEALKISIAIKKALWIRDLTERQYEALFTYYVVRGPLKLRLKAMSLSRDSLYDRIHRAHCNIEPWIDSDTVGADSVVGL